MILRPPLLVKDVYVMYFITPPFLHIHTCSNCLFLLARLLNSLALALSLSHTCSSSPIHLPNMTTHLRLSFISYMQCGMKLARHLALSPETRKEACDLLAMIHIECVYDPPTKYTLGVQEQIELIMQVSSHVV